jgi:2-polyprenyl-3-methyl-5-hydroxy-6-metoxy-1,4-benzoquinol methylase
MTDLINDREVKSQPHQNCYLCSGQSALLYQGLRDRHYNAPGIWDCRKCLNPACGLIWLDPKPLKTETVKLYRSYFTHENKGTAEDYEKKQKNLLIAGGYRAIKAMFSVITDYNKKRQQRDSMYLNDEKPGKILDVGCGTGDFLNRIRGLGWSVEGTELDGEAVINTRKKYGLNVHQGDLDDIILPENHYNAVTLSHVIEHVYDPIETIKKCRRILKPGGVLVLVTPNIDSFGHKLYKSNWLLLDPPRHLHMFSSITLNDIALKAGFNNISTTTNPTGNLAGFVGSQELETYGHYNLGEKPALFRYLKPVVLQFYELLAFKYNSSIGEELVLIARKNEK